MSNFLFFNGFNQIPRRLNEWLKSAKCDNFLLLYISRYHFHNFLELHLTIICKKNLVINSPYLKIHSNHQKQNLLRMEKVFVDALPLHFCNKWWQSTYIWNSFPCQKKMLRLKITIITRNYIRKTRKFYINLDIKGELLHV